MAPRKRKKVPMAAFQIKLKRTKGIKEKPKTFGAKAKAAPIKVPTPLPPANFKKQDQL